MNRPRSVVLAAGLVALATSLDGADARAATAGRRFTDADVRGAYAFSFQGTAGGAPVAAVGVIAANGKGRVTRGARTINLGGTTARQTFTCTYAVNPDGTGSATCPVSAPPRPTTETFDFVLEDGGRRFELLGTTAGTTVLGSGTRQ
jgi:hypothetical protein